MLTIDFDIGDVVFEDSGDIDLSEKENSVMCSARQCPLPTPEASRHWIRVECSALSKVVLRAGGVLPHLREGTLGEDAAENTEVSRRCRSQIETVQMVVDQSIRRRPTHIKRQVFPQAPSPTMTSLRRISAILLSHRTKR